MTEALFSVYKRQGSVFELLGSDLVADEMIPYAERKAIELSLELFSIASLDAIQSDGLFVLEQKEQVQECKNNNELAPLRDLREEWSAIYTPERKAQQRQALACERGGNRVDSNAVNDAVNQGIMARQSQSEPVQDSRPPGAEYGFKGREQRIFVAGERRGNAFNRRGLSG